MLTADISVAQVFCSIDSVIQCHICFFVETCEFVHGLSILSCKSEFVGIVRSVELGVRGFGSPADLDYKIGV
jgi:hypothetical protein